MFRISALDGEGTQELTWALQDWLDDEREKDFLTQAQAQADYADPDPRFDQTRGDEPTTDTSNS